LQTPDFLLESLDFADHGVLVGPSLQERAHIVHHFEARHIGRQRDPRDRLAREDVDSLQIVLAGCDIRKGVRERAASRTTRVAILRSPCAASSENRMISPVLSRRTPT
jgi:hypothetical protein